MRKVALLLAALTVASRAGPAPVLRRLQSRGGYSCEDKIKAVLSVGESVATDIENSDWTSALNDAMSLYNAVQDSLASCENCISDAGTVYDDATQAVSDVEAGNWSATLTGVEKVVEFFERAEQACIDLRRRVKTQSLEEGVRRRTGTTWSLLADGTNDEPGCDDAGMATDPRPRIANDLAACQARCAGAGKYFLQYHANAWCSCFDTCKLTRPASDYTSTATVYHTETGAAIMHLSKAIADDMANCTGGDCQIVKGIIGGYKSSSVDIKRGWNSSKLGGMGVSFPFSSTFPLRYIRETTFYRCTGGPAKVIPLEAGNLQACYEATESPHNECGKGSTALFNWNDSTRSCECLRSTQNCEGEDTDELYYDDERLWEIYRKLDVHLDATINILKPIFAQI